MNKLYHIVNDDDDDTEEYYYNEVQDHKKQTFHEKVTGENQVS